ncbi:MAG: 50S ribosomal protein L11 methyltransferase [Deltaproteobacteria bacterium]|nr:50S ribosomal protein L11 methyltransferase [Deltaproteobacteria bacterium]MBW2099166.1 50S ribosomal protein L11 methyltransferase [Deltaproteobacteria bacterium]
MIEKKKIKPAVKALVSAGELTYTYNYGCSFIEISFNKPVRISKHIVVKPPGIFYKPMSEDVEIELLHGASFGTGEHPTTRLAVRGMEYALKEIDFLRSKKKTCALDIGTGSGILAITAARLGIKKAIGTDIDPCARSEAKENVKINRLDDKIEICDRMIDNIDERFTLVTANLRYPTIKRIYSKIAEITEPAGGVVVSGIKEEEVPELLDIYTEKHFECKWKECEKSWAGLVFIKNA